MWISFPRKRAGANWASVSKAFLVNENTTCWEQTADSNEEKKKINNERVGGEQLEPRRAACKSWSAQGEITCFLFQLTLETYFLSSDFRSQKVANGMWAETHRRTFDPVTGHSLKHTHMPLATDTSPILSWLYLRKKSSIVFFKKSWRGSTCFCNKVQRGDSGLEAPRTEVQADGKRLASAHNQAVHAIQVRAVVHVVERVLQVPALDVQGFGKRRRNKERVWNHWFI